MVCLKRALKIAHAAQQQLQAALKTNDTQPVALFVEILNHYVYYYKQGLPSITSSVLQVRNSFSTRQSPSLVSCVCLICATESTATLCINGFTLHTFSRVTCELGDGHACGGECSLRLRVSARESGPGLVTKVVSL